MDVNARQARMASILETKKSLTISYSGTRYMPVTLHSNAVGFVFSFDESSILTGLELIEVIIETD